MKRRTARPTQHEAEKYDKDDKEGGGAVLEEWREGRMMRTHPPTGGRRGRGEEDARVQAGGRGAWGGALRAVLLPEGYPHSVSNDYATYQAWDTVQALCSSVTGLLCTRALLQGVGVGEAGATPGAAAIQWALRDGAGMIGRIVFAWMQGSELDNNSKTWRLMADILNDIGMTLELLSPLFPAYFFTLACAGSFCKAIVGVAGGATRAAITMHQARADNMADVAAKDGSQETAVTLVGLVLGLIITPLVEGNYGLIWLLFVLFTAAHLFANYRAVRGLVMDTFNRQRLDLVVEHFLSSHAREVLTPAQVSDREWPIWFACFDLKQRIHFGCSFSSVLRSSTLTSSHFIRMASRHPYLICLRSNNAAHVLPRQLDEPDAAEITDADCRVSGRASIEVLLRKDVDHEILIEAFAAALIARRTLAQLLRSEEGEEAVTVGLLRSSVIKSWRSLPELLAGLSKSGWHTHRSLLGPGPWRYSPSS